MTPWVVAVLGRLLPTAVLWLAVQHARGGGGSASGAGAGGGEGEIQGLHHLLCRAGAPPHWA